MSEYSVIELAYIGDAYFELKVREYILLSGVRKVDRLQSEGKKYSSAKGQADIFSKIEKLLTEDETDIFKRARNNKRSSHPKNTDLKTYKTSTGFEAIIGYLFIKGDFDRLNYLIEKIFNN